MKREKLKKANKVVKQVESSVRSKSVNGRQNRVHVNEKTTLVSPTSQSKQAINDRGPYHIVSEPSIQSRHCHQCERSNRHMNRPAVNANPQPNCRMRSIELYRVHAPRGGEDGRCGCTAPLCRGARAPMRRPLAHRGWRGADKARDGPRKLEVRFCRKRDVA